MRNTRKKQKNMLDTLEDNFKGALVSIGSIWHIVSITFAGDFFFAHLLITHDKNVQSNLSIIEFHSHIHLLSQKGKTKKRENKQLHLAQLFLIKHYLGNRKVIVIKTKLLRKSCFFRNYLAELSSAYK